MSTILVVGDSYTYGQGCKDRIYYFDEKTKTHLGKPFEYPNDPSSEYCWATLLNQQLPYYNVVNLASPGNSQFGIFKDTVDYINQHDDIALVLFNGTFMDRFSLAGYKDPEMIVPWCPAWGDDPDKINNPLYPIAYNEYRNARVQFYKYLTNDTIMYYQSLMSTLATYSFVTSKNIKFLWCNPETIHSDMNTKFKELEILKHLQYRHIARYDFSGRMDFEHNWNHYHFIDNHVNEAGHLMYFRQELFPLVKRTLNIV